LIIVAYGVTIEDAPGDNFGVFLSRERD